MRTVSFRRHPELHINSSYQKPSFRTGKRKISYILLGVGERLIIIIILLHNSVGSLLRSLWKQELHLKLEGPLGSAIGLLECLASNLCLLKRHR